MAVVPSFALLVFVLAVALGKEELYEVRGRIEEAALESPSAVRVWMRSAEGSLEGIPNFDGNFTFHVKPGQYYLEVHSMKYQFAPLRLEVSQKGEGNVRAQLAIDESGQSTVQSSKVPYPLVLKPMLESQYLTTASSMNPFSLLKSPMVIMMLVTGFMMLVMPMMTDYMKDLIEEEKREAAASAQSQARNQG